MEEMCANWGTRIHESVDSSIPEREERAEDENQDSRILGYELRVTRNSENICKMAHLRNLFQFFASVSCFCSVWKDKLVGSSEATEHWAGNVGFKSKLSWSVN